MITQALSEGLRGVVSWGLTKGLSGVVPQGVRTLGLAKSLSRVVPWEVAKSSSQVSLRCTIFFGSNVSGVHC